MLSCYGLLDLAQALARILFVESRERWDPDIGYYILVRDMTRWLVLTLINLAEITLCFSIWYVRWAAEFQPHLGGKVGALFQSVTTFTGVGGYVAVGYHARVTVILQLSYLVFFLVVVTPVVLSAFKAKQRTFERLGVVTGVARRTPAHQARAGRIVSGPPTGMGRRRHAWLLLVAGLITVLAVRRWGRGSWNDPCDEEPILR